MELKDMTWVEVEGLDRDIPVVIPIAAVEQHGHHLPLYTDSYLLGEVVARAAGRHEGDALFCPLLWLGNSHHHLDFKGTLSADPRVYLDLLHGLAENWIGHGFRRILFINGHGGNDVPGKQVIFELRQRYRQRDDLLLLMATYWSLGDLVVDGDFVQAEMGHACEWETSMMLALAAGSVKPGYASTEEVPFGNPFLPATRGWVTQDRSGPGHVGVPAEASAEKGERLFREFASGLSSMIDRVRDWDGAGWDG